MPINWKRPLTSGLQAARDANGRFFSALERRPRMGLSALGAGLVAPLLFENDERGYFQTSLITTPLISAGYMALDRALPAVQGEFSRMRGVFQTRSLPPGIRKRRARGREPGAADRDPSGVVRRPKKV